MSEPSEARDESVCVAHLVWAPLGLPPFERFLASYRANPGGVPHRLLVVYNGFAPGADLGAYRRALAGVAHDTLILPAPVQDIPAYFAAAAEARERYVCFLNSHSVLLDPLWLGKLLACLRQPRVGLVGATGSWGSLLSLHTLRNRGRGFYRGLFGRYASESHLPWRQFLWQVLRVLKWRFLGPSLPEYARLFAPFPCYHLRTNAFMLERETLLGLRHGEMPTKFEAYLFESGRDSLTAQILAGGQSALVVGRDGIGYEKEDWNRSGTLSQREQENLLVSDNQTREYELGNDRRRLFLNRFAWGRSAETDRRP